jgi:hypothetical protein
MTKVSAVDRNDSSQPSMAWVKSPPLSDLIFPRHLTHYHLALGFEVRELQFGLTPAFNGSVRAS